MVSLHVFHLNEIFNIPKLKKLESRRFISKAPSSASQLLLFAFHAVQIIYGEIIFQ